MKKNQLIEKIKLFAYQNKIDLFGITTAEPFDNLRPILQKSNMKLKGFVEQDIEKRINPKISLKDAKSIITIGVAYSVNLPEIPDNYPRGIMSKITFGLDYHILLKDKLNKLADFLLQFVQFQYKIFVDTGPLVEKALALRCGIGGYGKNNCIISKQYGSFFNIGYMLTTLELEYLENMNITDETICKNCKACLKACPTGAISKINGFFDLNKCISYLTQIKQELTEEQSKLIGTHIYGCDICQDVCPYNKIQNDLIKTADVNEAFPKLNDLINMTNNEFRKKYSKTACGWVGKKKLQQNSAKALINYNYKHNI